MASQITNQVTNNVTGNIETQIFSYTNSTGSDIYLQSIGGESNVRSEYFIYVGASLIKKYRTTTAFANIDIRMYDYTLSNGSTLEVKSKHYQTFTADYSVNLIYRVI